MIEEITINWKDGDKKLVVKQEGDEYMFCEWREGHLLIGGEGESRLYNADMIGSVIVKYTDVPAGTQEV